MAARFGGEAVNKRECILIASLGNQLPAGIKAISKPRDEERAQKILEDRGKSVAPGVGIDLEIVQGLIRADPTKELVGVFPDNPGGQHSKHHYLRRVEELMKHCKQPGGRKYQCRETGSKCTTPGRFTGNKNVCLVAGSNMDPRSNTSILDKPSVFMLVSS